MSSLRRQKSSFWINIVISNTSPVILSPIISILCMRRYSKVQHTCSDEGGAGHDVRGPRRTVHRRRLRRGAPLRYPAGPAAADR